MSAIPALSVVMPAFNEEDFLRDAVSEVIRGLRERRVEFELVVVENGSTDATLALAREIAAAEPVVRVQHLDTPDYGGALRAGMLAATGDVIVMFDVDFVDLDFLDRARARLDADDRPSIVVGSKRAPGSSDERSGLRRFATGVFQLMLRTVFGLGVSDTHGVKALRQADVTELAARCLTGTDLFDTELILRAERARLGVTEIPVTVRETRPPRTSIMRRVPRTLVGLARLRWLLWREGK